MRKLCRSFAYLSAVIGFVTVISCCEKHITPDQNDKAKFRLDIGRQKIGALENSEFVDLRKPDGKDVFDAALSKLPPEQYKIHFKADNGIFTEDYHPSSTPGINTEKTTTSELAKPGHAGDSTANDPNATYRVRSNNPKEISAVLDAFPTPTP